MRIDSAIGSERQWARRDKAIPHGRTGGVLTGNGASGNESCSARTHAADNGEAFAYRDPLSSPSLSRLRERPDEEESDPDRFREDDRAREDDRSFVDRERTRSEDWRVRVRVRDWVRVRSVLRVRCMSGGLGGDQFCGGTRDPARRRSSSERCRVRVRSSLRVRVPRSLAVRGARPMRPSSLVRVGRSIAQLRGDRSPDVRPTRPRRGSEAPLDCPMRPPDLDE